MITVTTLFSGSSGNSTLLSDGATNILIDAGRNCKAVCAALNEVHLDLADISAIFITHEHSDHISALDVMMRKRAIPIHVTLLSAGELSKKRSACENAEVHEKSLYEVRVGSLLVHSFLLPHDSAECVGYTVSSDDGDRAAVATDLGFASVSTFNELKGCRSVVIESNHDVNTLKNGSYPYILKQRILSRRGHLSNESCAELCMGLAESGTEHIMLAHLSQENNTPELAYSCTKRALESVGRGDVELCVAPRECTKSLSCLNGWC